MAMIKQVYEGEGVLMTAPDGAEALVYFDGFVGGRPTPFVRLVIDSTDAGDGEREAIRGAGLDFELEGYACEVVFHGFVGGDEPRSQTNLRIHAPRAVRIETADARLDAPEPGA